MAMIRKLSDSVINKIAAGEVIERPASAVKELVENSLDAESDSITVSILEGGKSLIKVIDNGCGMSEEEALLSIERHTTSKIENEKDLERIQTFGFRGEALPSIAAVSLFTLSTCQNEIEGATIIEAEGGKIKNIRKKGAVKGTTIEVRNLFFNTPARRKFLKSTATEQGHIDDCMTKLSLSKDSVEFLYIVNNRETFHILKTDKLLDKIAKIFGNELFSNLIEIDSPGEISIHGYITNPSFTKGNRNWQYIFVNGRSIRDKGIYHAINRGYGETIKGGQHPALFLFIDINPANVDVNIHPSKQEVRFSDSSKVVSAVIHSIRRALGGERKIKTVKFSDKSSNQLKGEKFNLFESYTFEDENELADFIAARETEELKEDTEFIIRDTGKEREEKFEYSSLEIIGQIKNSYIIAQSENEIFFIDQHAAHERVLFEKIKESFFKGKIESQNLLIPLVIELSIKEINLWKENISNFEKLGLFAEEFGGNTLRITAVPAILKDKDPEVFFKNCLKKIDEKGEGDETSYILNSLFQSLACHSAIRANHRLDMREMENLLKLMDHTVFSTYCPHGRNAVFKIATSQIEKFFDRH